MLYLAELRARCLFAPDFCRNPASLQVRARFSGKSQLPCKFVSGFLKSLTFPVNSCQVFWNHSATLQIRVSVFWNHSAALQIRVRFFEITQLPCKFVSGFLKTLSCLANS